MSERNIVSSLVGDRPEWKPFFENVLMFKLGKDNVTSLVSRLNINTRDSFTVWSNAIPSYPEIRPVTAEQINEVEKYLFGYAKRNTAFYFTHQQIEYMSGKPTLFDRQQGASLAFAVLLLLQKGQPLLVEKDPRELTHNITDNCVLFHYSDMHETCKQNRENFTRLLVDVASYIMKAGGEDLIRDVIVIHEGKKLTSIRSIAVGKPTDIEF